MEKRLRGLDWPLKAHSMIGKARMQNVRAAVEHVQAGPLRPWEKIYRGRE
jgi:hypothetical protein